MIEAKHYTEFALPPWTRQDTETTADGSTMLGLMPTDHPVHDVIVVADPCEDPAERWLALCLCEEGTSPQATLEAAIEDGWRHLHDRGVERPVVGAYQP